MVHVNVFVILFIVIFDSVFSSSPITTQSTILNEHNSESVDYHKLDVNVEILTTITHLQEQMNRFNDLYMNRLDQKLTALAVNVAKLDSNVRNIQDRAHVWDTFQLHVAAWNEQIKSLDKKADLISSGQEKIMLLEGKMSFLLNLEYNSQRSLNKLSNLEDKLDIIDKSMKNKQNIQPSPIYEEFAVRGALSTLKTVEQKVDNTNKLLHQFTHKIMKTEKNRNDINTTNDIPKSVTCGMPIEIEELIKDVASKIDLIHDKTVVDNNEDNDDESSTEKNCSTEPPGTIDKINDLINKFYEQHQMLLNISSKIACHDHEMNISHILIEEKLNYSDIMDNEYTTVVYSTASTPSDLDYNETDDDVSTISYSDIYSASSYVEKYSSSLYLEDEEIATTAETSTIDDTFNMIYNDVGNLSLDIINRLKMYKNIVNFCEYPESERYCDHNGNIVIQSRNGDENFSRSWLEYKWGFGELANGNFWIGNEAMHYLTREATTILRVDLEDFNQDVAWAEYDNFKVGPESTDYILEVSGYRGNASDSLIYHNGSKFSTFDVTNDESPVCCPCSVSYGGGWWFKSCFESNLNGMYYESPVKNDYHGIIWEKWQDDVSLSKTKMAVKIISQSDSRVI